MTFHTYAWGKKFSWELFLADLCTLNLFSVSRALPYGYCYVMVAQQANTFLKSTTETPEQKRS